MTRLFGAHFQGSTSESIASAHRANAIAVKVMDPDPGPVLDLIARQIPGSYVILRKWYHPDDQAEMRRQGPDTAERVVTESRNHFRQIIEIAFLANLPIYLEGLNEPDPNPHPALAELSTWYEAFADRAAHANLRPLAYSFGTGNPPSYGWGPGSPFATFEESLRAQWRTLLPGLRACVDKRGALALHAYDWPGVLSDPYWQGLRFLNDFDAIAANDPELANRTDLMLTEWDIDVGIRAEYVQQFGERKGWKTALHGDGAEFARQAEAYQAEVLRSRWGSRVKGIFPFTLAPEGSWIDYSPEGVPEFEQMAAREPQGAEIMPKPTVITAKNRPAARPGEYALFQFSATGVDGFAKIIADVSYPVLPNNEFGSTYGPNQTTVLDNIKGDGDHSVAVLVPPVTTPLPASGVVASIRFRFFELDVNGERDAGEAGPFPLDVFSQLVPVVPPPPPGDPSFPSDAIRARYDSIYSEIMHLEMDTGATEQDKKFKSAVLELIKWRKGEIPYPFR